jgi:hypothetical protein
VLWHAASLGLKKMMQRKTKKGRGRKTENERERERKKELNERG